MEKLKTKQGFTLAEAVITLSLLAVIASILIPTATNISPSTLKTPFRNAYSITAETISTLISNEVLYPSTKVLSPEKPIPLGFLYTETGTKTQKKDDGTVIVSETNDLAWEYESVVSNCKCKSGSKLVRAFCCSLNPTTALCSNATSDTDSRCNFTTNNQMVWSVVQNRNCSSSDTGRKEPILYVEVDVNGNASPNSATVSRPDRFKFSVYYNGRIELTSGYGSISKAKAYLESPTDNKRDRR